MDSDHDGFVARIVAKYTRLAQVNAEEITIRLCDLGQSTLVIWESSRMSDGINKGSFRVEEACR